MHKKNSLDWGLLAIVVFLLLGIFWVWRGYVSSVVHRFEFNNLPEEVFVQPISTSTATIPLSSSRFTVTSSRAKSRDLDSSERDSSTSLRPSQTDVEGVFDDSLLDSRFRGNDNQEGGNEIKDDVDEVVEFVESSAEEINLSVPFMVQAPHGDWSMPYQEACEEASVLMAAAYVKGEPKSWTKDEADLELQKLVVWENKIFGYYEDTTLVETQRMLKEYSGVDSSRILSDPTAAQLRAELAQGNLILVPAYGKELANPNFRNGGPLFHMLVIKGYTKDGFITNDPGTRNGHNFFYKDVGLLGAIHDWNGGDVQNGKRVVLVVSR
jgi:hypothetical protein